MLRIQAATEANKMAALAKKASLAAQLPGAAAEKNKVCVPPTCPRERARRPASRRDATTACAACRRTKPGRIDLASAQSTTNLGPGNKPQCAVRRMQGASALSLSRSR